MSPTMTCSDCQKRLLDYEGELLTAGERSEVAQHLLTCSSCRAELEAIRLAQARLTGWPDQDPPPGLAERTLEHLTRSHRLERAITAEIPKARHLRQARFQFHPWISSIAAAALVAVGGYYTHLDQLQVRLATEIYGSSDLEPASMSMLRLSLFDATTRSPIADKPVVVSLRTTDNQLHPLFHGKSDAQGQVAAQVQVPELPDGDYQLVVEAADGIDHDQVTRTIAVKRSYRLMLSSDKPLYQPGQTIHARALLFETASGHPAERRVLTLSVQDPKGSRIFKKAVAVDRFGVAAFDLPLADELNLGAYKVVGEVGDTRGELDVQVSRYSLPKFEVKVEPDVPFARPGATVTGHVTCRYFFGKPCDDASITLSAGVLVDGFREVASVQGSADAAGSYRFELPLPLALPGTSFAEGNALVQLNATVKDKAGQTVEKHGELIVSEQDLMVTAIPEDGALLPEKENHLLVLVARPDGEAVAKARVTVAGTSTVLTTADDGVAMVPFTPHAGRRDISLAVTAPDGARLSRTFELTAKPAFAIVRSDKSLYAVGQTLAGEIVSSSATQLAFLDVVRDGRTVATQTVDLASGQGHFALDLTPDMAGTLALEVYSRQGGETGRVRRTVYVADPRGLKVEVVADKASFRPGEKIKLNFKVTDERGQPTAAGLGVSVVDESVFALANQDPSMLKAYLTLAARLREPQFNLNPAKVISGGSEQNEAALLFAAADPPRASRLLGKTDPRDWQQRESSLSQIRVGRQHTAGIVGIVLLCLMLEGVLRWVAEKVLHVAVTTPLGWLVLACFGLYCVLAFGAHDAEAAFILSGILFLIGAAFLTVSSRFWNDIRFSTVLLTTGGLAMCLIGLLTVFGDNIRKIFGASVDALANSTTATTNARRTANPSAAHRNIVDFASMSTMEGDGPSPSYSPRAAPPPKGSASKPAPDSLKDESAPAEEPAALTSQQKSNVRVRSFFPETLFWAPEVIADGSGLAQLELPGADSITSWRTAITATSSDGRLGTGLGAVKVFQDFFVDAQLPPVLTEGDEVEIPIAVYNYLDTPQQLKLEVEKAPWLQALTASAFVLELQPGQVAGVSFRFRATHFGKAQPFTVYAVGDHLSDAVRRDVEVRPDGVPFEVVANGTSGPSDQAHAVLPAKSIANASHAELRLYPSAFSAVMDGLENVIRMPNGCFEQTSSTTYPNALVLDYLRTNKKGSPELLARAEEYLTTGYQRLLTFEVNGGGFEWFGRAPANQVLSAYGLLEFSDLARVFPVDEQLVQRTQRFLAERQGADGSWPADARALYDGLYRDQFGGSLTTTAYVAWSLAESGYRGDATDRVARFLELHGGETADPYTQALIANALLDLAPSHAEDAVRRLANSFRREGKLGYWSAGGSTLVYSHGNGADVETTALAAEAMMKAHRNSDALAALGWLLQARDPHGTWSSTQATVFALRALLHAASMPTLASVQGHLAVRGASGQSKDITFTANQSDVVQRLDVTPWLHGGSIDLTFDGDLAVSYQLELSGYRAREVEDQPALALDLTYDHPTLSVDDTITARLNACYQRPGASGMVLISAAIPPGFEPVIDDLQALVSGGSVAKYTTDGKEVRLYVDRLRQGQPAAFEYHLRARYPVKAIAPASRAYLFYQPEIQAESKAIPLIVAARN